MADVKIIDIKGSQWNLKDEVARARIVTIEEKVDKNSAYSTEEIDTGKKWIDGKPIYRKVINISANNLRNWSHIPETDNLLIEKIIKVTAMGTADSYQDCVTFPYVRRNQNGKFAFTTLDWNLIATVIILEYTKTIA